MNEQNPQQHTEAFMLMKYANPEGTIVEWIWNSRDGVAPFSVPCRPEARTAGGPGEKFEAWVLFHQQWEQDTYRPDYRPLYAERLFVTSERPDGTKAPALIYAHQWPGFWSNRLEALKEARKATPPHTNQRTILEQQITACEARRIAAMDKLATTNPMP